MTSIQKRIHTNYLPDSVQDLVELIGLAAALAIVEERGGIRLCVPTRATPGHWLAKAIGMEAFGTLVYAYAREEIDIPLCKEAMLRVRETKILREYTDGASQAELALKYGYTERGIRKLLRRAEDNEQMAANQLELF